MSGEKRTEVCGIIKTSSTRAAPSLHGASVAANAIACGRFSVRSMRYVQDPPYRIGNDGWYWLAKLGIAGQGCCTLQRGHVVPETRLGSGPRLGYHLTGAGAQRESDFFGRKYGFLLT